MATARIALIDGDGLTTGTATVDYDGVGDGEASVTAEECVGLDREGTVTFKADGCEDVVRRVFQLGLREMFTDDDFHVSDGGTFHVLKDEAVVNNYYEFVGSDEGDSVVTIDGENVSVPAGATVKGYFADDISAIPTNNLKKIKIIGDVSLTIGDSDGTYNYTIEEAEFDFVGKTSRRFDNFLRRCDSLRSLVVRNINAKTYLTRVFAGLSNLETFAFSIIDTSAVTNMQHLISWCSKLKSADLSSVDVSCSNTTSSSIYISYVAYQCGKLETISISGWKPAINAKEGVTIAFDYMFQYCYYLNTIDMSNCDFIRCKSYTNSFGQCSRLTNIIGPVSNIMASLSFSACPLTRESALVFINGLSDEPTEENPTLTLSSTTKALLTDEDIKIATDKGWTIA